MSRQAIAKFDGLCVAKDKGIILRRPDDYIEFLQI